MNKVKEIVNRAMVLRNSLLEPEAKALINSIGITTPSFDIANDSEEAVEIAKSIGYPVVLKVISPDIIHKTDVGGVILGAKNEKQVRRDYSKITENIKRKIPEAKIEGVLIERLATPSLEVIIGGLRDSQFGPTIMLGLGGIFTEILKDLSFRLTPVTKGETFGMMEELKGCPLLNGYRGSKPLDKESLSDAMVSISNLMTEVEEIKEIDLNPVFLYPKGLTAVDARVILG